MNRLIAVHAPAARRGEIVVISVELWSECVFVHLARGLTDEMQRDWDEWAETASRLMLSSGRDTVELAL